MANKPPRWGLGFHDLEPEYGPGTHPAYEPDPDLLLVHLHGADFDLAIARSRANARLCWSELDLRMGYGCQNRIEDAARLAAYFDADGDTGGELDRPCEIPDAIRALA